MSSVALHPNAASSQAAQAGETDRSLPSVSPATLPSPERKSLTASRAICGHPLASGDGRRAAGEALSILEKTETKQVGAPLYSPWTARRCFLW